MKQTTLIWGLPHTSISWISLNHLASYCVPSMIFLLNSTYFFFPSDCITNHAPAAPTPHLDPWELGTAYAPPDHVAIAKNAYYLNALVLYNTVDTPFGAIPCLCWSQEIDVTPSRVKSNFPKSTPWSLAKIAVNPPKQASTCNPIFFLFAMAANYSIGSHVP